MALMLLADAGKSQFLKQVVYPSAWLFTNSGFIAVLYSRLHLIVDAPLALKRLMWGLLGIGIPFQIFLIVASTGSPFHMGMAVHNVCYRLEPIVTFVEIGMSGCYVWFFFTKFIHNGIRPSHGGMATQRQLQWTFIVLILGEVFVVAGDIAIVTVWYDGLFLVRLAIAPLIYALKLKVEFLILNRLTSITQQSAELRHITISITEDTNDNTATAAALAAATILENASSVNRRQTAATIHVSSSKSGDISTSRDSIQPGESKCSAVQHDAHEVQEVPSELGLEIQRRSIDELERQYLGRTTLRERQDFV